MKLNKSEKVLMTVLIAVLLIFGYYKLIYMNEVKAIGSLKNEKTAYRDKLDNIKLQVSLANKREKDIKIINSNLQQKIGNFYPVIEQEKLIVELDDILKKSNLEGSISFSASTQANDPNSKVSSSTTTTGTTSAGTTSKNAAKALPDLQSIVNQYNVLTNAKAADTKSIKGAKQYMQSNISFKGSYTNVMSFIKNVEGHQKKIMISSFNISGGSDSDIAGTVTLEFYAIPKLAGTDDNYLNWGYSGSYGKQDPFSAGASSVINTTIEAAAIQNPDIKDFAMSVRSVNSDLPATMMGTYNDKTMGTYVYDDLNGVDSAEIYLTEANGKFYYKYKLGNNSYPVQYSGNGVEFTPANGDISLAIFSNKRISATDNSGVNLRVVNNTSKVVNIYISNDDGSRPRVSVKAEGNAVNIKN